MITREQWNGLNFRKIEEHSKEIEEYPGEIPLILYDTISISNRIEYLNSINQKYEYGKIKEYRKKQDTETDIKDVIKFVNDNQEFIDIIKIKK